MPENREGLEAITGEPVIPSLQGQHAATGKCPSAHAKGGLFFGEPALLFTADTETGFLLLAAETLPCSHSVLFPFYSFISLCLGLWNLPPALLAPNLFMFSDQVSFLRFGQHSLHMAVRFVILLQCRLRQTHTPPSFSSGDSEGTSHRHPPQLHIIPPGEQSLF